MLAVTRRNTILEMIRERQSVNVSELADAFGVTKETIRRDFKVLEGQGELTRTHGGAYITEGVRNDIAVNTRAVIRKQEKEAIARKCVELIDTGDSIFIDPSTTCWFLAEAVAEKHITVLTNSLKVAEILAKSSTVNLVVVGGTYARKSMAFLGGQAANELKHFYVDKAFISCRTVNMENGVTDSNEDISFLRQIMLRNSRRSYLVADHTKIDGISFLHMCDLDELTAIVCDRPLSSAWQNHLASIGVQAI